MALIERARKVRETLFGRYDELNALWLQAEQELTKLHIPRPAHCFYNCENYGNGDFEEERLGVQKIKGAWKICHSFCSGSFCSEHENLNWTPITECSVEIRVEAAKYLPNLREAIVKSAEDFIPKVEGAIEELKQSLNVPDEHLRELLAERAKFNGNGKLK